MNCGGGGGAPSATRSRDLGHATFQPKLLTDARQMVRWRGEASPIGDVSPCLAGGQAAEWLPDLHAGGTMRTILSGRAMLVSLAVLAAVGVAACTAHPAGNAASPSNGQTTTPAATTAASPPAAGSSATPTRPGGIQNLVITIAEKNEL